MSAEYAAKRRARFRDAGLCIDCGRDPKPGRVRCVACLDRHYQPLKRRRVMLKDSQNGSIKCKYAQTSLFAFICTLIASPFMTAKHFLEIFR